MKRPSNIPTLNEIYNSPPIQAEQQAAQSAAAAKPDNSPMDWWSWTLPPHDRDRVPAAQALNRQQPEPKAGA